MNPRAAIVVGFVLVSALLGSCARETLVGTDLGGQPAPDFTLLDAVSGEHVTLSAQRGRAVLLTFLYTRCPDVCPLTTEKIRIAADGLGNRQEKVSLLAVSVDPPHDTPQAIRDFLDAHSLKGRLRYLIGDAASLAAVWRAYSVAVASSDESVTHFDAIILIDKRGRARTLLHSDAEPKAIERDLRLLSNE